MKRSLSEVADENTPLFSSEALEHFKNKDEKRFNSREDKGSIFESICKNKDNFNKLMIDGKPVGKYIADL